MKGIYAFVNLATPAEARRAINELSENEILGSKIRVELARGEPWTSCDKNEGAAIGKERVSKGQRYLTAGNEEVTDGNFSETRANGVSFSTDSAKETEDRLGQDLEDEEHSSKHEVILEVPPTPSTPPPGYTWVLTPQWILSRRDSPPPLGSQVQVEDAELVALPESRRNLEQDHHRFEPYIDTQQAESDGQLVQTPRAATPSPSVPVKDEVSRRCWGHTRFLSCCLMSLRSSPSFSQNTLYRAY
jgi:RNA recognition motif-containing protein